MFGHIARFYLYSMLLAFVITLYVGSAGVHPALIFWLAMLAWPASALILLVNAKIERIRYVTRK